MVEFSREVITAYAWDVFLIHSVCALAIFFIVNWVGEQSISVGYLSMSVVVKEDSAAAFNFVFKVITPVVLYVIFIVVFQQVDLVSVLYNSYLIVVYYWVIRVLFVIITNRASLMNWLTQFIFWSCSIGLSYWIYTLTERVNEILPEPRALLDQLWILIIIFVYGMFNKLVVGRQSSIRRKNKYISSRYHKFKLKYNDVVKDIDDEFYQAISVH